MFNGSIESDLKNHSNLQLSCNDCRRFKRLHKSGSVANACHYAIEDIAADEIGKLNDGALLKFLYRF